MFKFVLMAMLLLPDLAIAENNEKSTPNQSNSYTVAILPFATKSKEIEDMSLDVPALMNVFLSATPELMLVERGEVDKALSEVELGMSGTVDPNTAAKVGHLTGAQILVTGRVFTVRKDLIMIAKIIGVETGRVYGENATMPITGSAKDAAMELSQRVAANILKNGETMIVRAENKEDIITKLKKLMGDRKDLPTVSVSITERSINRDTLDPAAETEIKYILQQVGFTIVDKMESNKKADIDVTGEAFSEFAMRKGNLVSSKARVEIKAIKRSDGSMILVDREPTVAVDLSPEFAGKKAVAKAASQITERLVKSILDSAK